MVLVSFFVFSEELTVFFLHINIQTYGRLLVKAINHIIQF